MNIAITVDPEIEVPPVFYGGIERVVYMLVEELVARGHNVVLFANENSNVSCSLIPLKRTLKFSFVSIALNSFSITREVVRRKVQVIHSFGRLANLIPVLIGGLPIVMTYQRYITPRSIMLGNFLSRGKIRFTGVSSQLIQSVSGQGHWQVVYNGVPLDKYAPVVDVPEDAPLVFLGRIEHHKGVHVAIEVAKTSGRRLIIAGNIPELSEAKTYFANEVEPWIDQKLIQYVGAVDDSQKNKLLGSAAALLMPILWDEPFGIVMAEALACGTPVIGLNRGSVPEIVENGVSGFVCETPKEMEAAVGRIREIDRRNCRNAAETRFSEAIIVNKYEHLYAAITAPVAI